MNAQNNTPQQHPAAAASSPTESDLWEAAFSSDDPTVVLTDEELNAARHAHEKARKSSSSAQSSQDATRPLTGAATATQPTLSPDATYQGAESGANFGKPGDDNLSWLDKPTLPSPDNVRNGATAAPATATSYEVPTPSNAPAASSTPQAAPRQMTTSSSPPPQVMPLLRNPSSPPQPRCPCRRAATPACTCCPVCSAG